MRTDKTNLDDPASEQMLDVMLCEALDGAAPPNLTDQILAILDADKKSTQLCGAQTSDAANLSPVTKSNRTNWWGLAAAAVLLIALGGSLPWLFGSLNPDINVAEQEATDQPSDIDPLAVETGPTLATDANATREPVDEVDFPTKIHDVPFAQSNRNRPEDEDRPNSESRTQPDRLASAEIVAKVNEHLLQAWKRLNIAPMPTVDDAEVAERLTSILAGTSNVASNSASDEIDDQSLIEFVRNDAVSTHLGHRWAKYLFGATAWKRLTNPQQRQAVELFASCFRGNQSFDAVAEEMVSATGSANPDATDFDAAALWLASLSESPPVTLTNQFCNVFLDVDASCGRCHQHPLDGQLSQQNYWNLTAIFQFDGVNRKPNSKRALFFENLDGIQTAAIAQTSGSWMGFDDAEIDRRIDLADQLRDSDRLAKATVNGLWNLVFGNRLVGRTSDPLAPPADEDFSECRDFLASQLRAHNYDLGAAISWIASSRPMRAGIAKSPLEQASLAASPAELEETEMQRRAFAAFATKDYDWSFNELVATVENFNRGSSLADDILLAQPIDKPSGGSAKGPSKAELRKQALLRTFPYQSATAALPAGWLARLQGHGGFSQQARHLYYVAGYTEPSSQQLKAAERIRKTTKTDESAIHQLWWAIELSKNSQ